MNDLNLIMKTLEDLDIIIQEINFLDLEILELMEIMNMEDLKMKNSRIPT